MAREKRLSGRVGALLVAAGLLAPPLLLSAAGAEAAGDLPDVSLTPAADAALPTIDLTTDDAGAAKGLFTLSQSGMMDVTGVRLSVVLGTATVQFSSPGADATTRPGVPARADRHVARH